jgi:hypothetical protein
LDKPAEVWLRLGFAVEDGCEDLSDRRDALRNGDDDYRAVLHGLYLLKERSTAEAYLQLQDGSEEGFVSTAL